MKRLEGKVAIVTGASSGIGFEAAKLFAEEGAKVVVCARRRSQLDDLVGIIKSKGGQAFAVVGDVGDESCAKAVVSAAMREFGGLDIAFNNAGTLGQGGDIVDIPLQAWTDTININLTSAFMLAKEQIPAMRKRGGGSLIFTSTFVGHSVGLPGMSAYAASKMGLLGLTKVLAVENGPINIRVNMLLPGGTATPMSDSFIDSEDTREWVKSIHALKRMAKPEEIARAALFLASSESSFVTGTEFVVDGGASICK